jgi:hypothetical protein
MMIIERKDAGDLRDIKKWLLVYGRRRLGRPS